MQPPKIKCIDLKKWNSKFLLLWQQLPFVPCRWAASLIQSKSDVAIVSTSQIRFFIHLHAKQNIYFLLEVGKKICRNFSEGVLILGRLWHGYSSYYITSNLSRFHHALLLQHTQETFHYLRFISKSHGSNFNNPNFLRDHHY